jgi:hypothetical protein
VCYAPLSLDKPRKKEGLNTGQANERFKEDLTSISETTGHSFLPFKIFACLLMLCIKLDILMVSSILTNFPFLWKKVGLRGQHSGCVPLAINFEPVDQVSQNLVFILSQRSPYCIY